MTCSVQWLARPSPTRNWTPDKLPRMKKLDKAARALLGMGSVPDKEPPKFTKADLKRKFRMRVDRKGKGRVEEV